MLKRYERYMRVYAPPTDEGDGEVLGYYPISLSFRTSEEVESGDVLYTNLRFSGYASGRRSPTGGYRRGMILEDPETGARYHILVPTQVRDMWVIKAERAILNGEGESFGRV